MLFDLRYIRHMAIYITGDIHGNPVRLGVNSFYEQKEFDKDNKDENIVIILGDFGLVWKYAWWFFICTYR